MSDDIMASRSESDIFSTQDVEISDSNQVEFQSGLQSSEIDRSLSYTELSSLEPTNVALRPGVNDDQGTGIALHSEVGTPEAIVGRIYATDMDRGVFMEKFKRFILDYKTDVPDEGFSTDIIFDPNSSLYLQKLKELNLRRINWLHINCQHLAEYSSELHHDIITYPKEVIPTMDSVVDSLFRTCYQDSLIPMIQTRPYNCEQSRNLRNLNPEDLDQLVTVNGLVIRLSGIIPEMTKAHFKCSICNSVTSVLCEMGRFLEPESCTHCNANHTQRIIHNFCEFSDKQLVKLQESPEEMPSGQTPHTINLYCHQDLVDTVQPGDRVTVTGIFRSQSQRESSRIRTIKNVLMTYIDVLHFEKAANRLRDGTEKASLTTERIEEIKKLSQTPDYYERLSTAIAPSIYGNDNIKKGILLQLFGGVSKDMKKVGGSRDSRGDIHILLCGDPGTSKSQLLQYVFNLTPRSQYISGKGSSEVGLTAYVTRDPETKHLTLQTGALVLADGGVCCIDEFDKMPDSTRSVLHEVMEQQTLSIAKAGVICQLNARTCVLAAANPVGSNWDPKKTIIENIQLPPTLLSRFDLIFLILDPQDESYDTRLARHLLNLYHQADDGTPAVADDGTVSMQLLRDYISYAKETVRPELSLEARDYLIAEYVEMRKLGSRSKGQVGAYPRQLESLIRLSEAHARMRLSNVVTINDCEEARRLQLEALKQAATDPQTGLIDIDILTTGVSGAIKKRREEMAAAIYKVLESERAASVNYQRLLEKVKENSDRMVTRDTFEDGLNLLKISNKIDWSGKIIRRR